MYRRLTIFPMVFLWFSMVFPMFCPSRPGPERGRRTLRRRRGNGCARPFEDPQRGIYSDMMGIEWELPASKQTYLYWNIL